MTADEAQAVRAAEHQSLFREVNERIQDLNEQFATTSATGDWICECADETCFEPISLTVAEYEAIRAHSARFPVMHGHERPDVETVVEVHERYLVVEKLGYARNTAIAHDPRKK